jgi:hypothetical protein
VRNAEVEPADLGGMLRQTLSVAPVRIALVRQRHGPGKLIPSLNGATRAIVAIFTITRHVITRIGAGG